MSPILYGCLVASKAVIHRTPFLRKFGYYPHFAFGVHYLLQIFIDIFIYNQFTVF